MQKHETGFRTGKVWTSKRVHPVTSDEKKKDDNLVVAGLALTGMGVIMWLSVYVPNHGWPLF